MCRIQIVFVMGFIAFYAEILYDAYIIHNVDCDGTLFSVPIPIIAMLAWCDAMRHDIHSFKRNLNIWRFQTTFIMVSVIVLEPTT